MSLTTGLKITLVMLLWAVCFPLITLGIAHAPHLSFATLRAALAGLALTGLAVALRRPAPNGWRAWAVIGAIGLGATSLGFLGMFHAAEFVSPGVATVIANTQPLLAAVLAGVFLSERLSRRAVVGLLLGFAGILVITAPELLANRGESYALGVAYIILAALGVTISNVLIKRIAGQVDLLMAMGLQMMIGAIPLAVAAAATEDPTTIQWSAPFIGSLLALSLLGTALVYWLWSAVLARTPLTRANAFSFLIPVFGLTMGALFFGETLSWLQGGGVVLTVAGVAIVARAEGR